jgi:Xaa-Pro aminopeptidase
MSNENAMIIGEKLKLIPQLLQDHGIDAWLVIAREDSDPLVSYFLEGHLVMESAFLFTSQGNSAFLGHIDMMNGHERNFQSVTEYSPGNLNDELVPALHRLDPKTLALNYSDGDHTADGLTHGLYRKLEAAVGPDWLAERAISSEDIVADLRGIKSPTELALMRTAAEITLTVAERMTPRLYPGITHGELRELFEHVVAEDGRATPEFFIPTSGCIGEIFRGQPEYPVRMGDSLILDMGVRYKGYTSDYKRMWYFLQPGETEPPKQLQTVFDLCQQIIQETADALRPGTPGCDVDALARKRLTEAGYEEFKHALGHQVGRAVHDGGVSLGPADRYAHASNPVQANMVISLEPAVKMLEYHPVAPEDLGIVQKEGPAEFFIPRQEQIWLVESK